MTAKETAASTIILLCTGTLGALAGEPAPGKPEECRRRVLEEIDRFRKLKAPPSLGPGDEHIARHIARSFVELKAETTLILAVAGDKDSVKALIRDYGLEEPKLERWIEAGHVRYRDGTFWPRQLFDVARVMDAHRPDLAKKMREEMMRLAKSEARTAAPDKLNFDRMTLPELKQAAGAGEEEAMLRWARLDPAAAAAVLVQGMHDEKRSVLEQRLAAQALAAIPDERGLKWLRRAVLDSRKNGRPGLGMLLAGDAGQRQYFDMIADFEKKKAELPNALADAPLELNAELFCKLLPRLLEVRDKALRENVSYAVRRHRLPAATLVDLMDRVRKGNYTNATLRNSLCDSLVYSGWEDLAARQAAHLWADEMLQRDVGDDWQCGAHLFLRCGLGSKDVAAASARRQLSTLTELAAEVLAEAGRAEDALLIWAATHAPREKETENWYERPALGWFATVRLTNHLAAPK